MISRAQTVNTERLSSRLQTSRDVFEPSYATQPHGTTKRFCGVDVGWHYGWMMCMQVEKAKKINVCSGLFGTSRPPVTTAGDGYDTIHHFETKTGAPGPSGRLKT